jgi:hypothetical protein
MASILVCDKCGKQVPDPGTMGIADWMVLRRSDFRGQATSFCRLDCLLSYVIGLKAAEDAAEEEAEREREEREQEEMTQEELLEDLISGKLRMP